MPMKLWRDGAAVVIALLAFGLGLMPLTVFSYETGLRLAVDDSASRLIVSSVDPWSPAARDGVESGMIVVGMNGITLLALPQAIYVDVPASGDPDGEVTTVFQGIQPPVPTSNVTLEVLATFSA